MAAISNLKKREKLINDESQDMNVAISRKFLQVFLIWLKFCKFIFRNWTKKLKTDRVPFRCTAAVRQIVFHQMISSHITYVGHCQRKASQVLLPYEQYKSGHLPTTLRTGDKVWAATYPLLFHTKRINLVVWNENWINLK